MNVDIINPTTYPHWDDLLLTHPETTFFQTAAWARVLSETYGYRPLYFTLVEDGCLAGLIAMMEVNSPLTGKRGVSLPFTDECQPVSKNSEYFSACMDAVLTLGHKAGWEYIQIRGGQGHLIRAASNCQYYAHVLDLSPEVSQIFKGFKGSVKRNIKRAQREEIRVEMSNTSDAIETFWRLNCLTRKKHGLPPQPIQFFRNIYKHAIKKGKGLVALAFHGMKAVAGAVYFRWNRKAVYKYGASDSKYLDLRPNNLVMWEAIRRHVETGCRSLDFGRTERENAGLMQFKRGWGADERELHYFAYDLRKNRYVEAASGPKSSYFLFRHLPIPVLRLAGNLLYKHVG